MWVGGAGLGFGCPMLMVGNFFSIHPRPKWGSRILKWGKGFFIIYNSLIRTEKTLDIRTLHVLCQKNLQKSQLKGFQGYPTLISNLEPFDNKSSKPFGKIFSTLTST